VTRLPCRVEAAVRRFFVCSIPFAFRGPNVPRLSARNFTCVYHRWALPLLPPVSTQHACYSLTRVYSCFNKNSVEDVRRQMLSFKRQDSHLLERFHMQTFTRPPRVQGPRNTIVFYSSHKQAAKDGCMSTTSKSRGRCNGILYAVHMVHKSGAIFVPYRCLYPVHYSALCRPAV
jgi:hypothetical protein